MLVGGSRDAPVRQQTLRATLDWSYALLRDDERALLRQFAVFAGGFTLDAVEDVCAVPAQSGEILDGLARLVDSSLVVADAHATHGLTAAESHYNAVNPTGDFCSLN